MPINDTLVPKKHPYAIRFGQTGLTKFRNYRSAIKVELLNPEPKDQMMKRLYQFVRATWADNPDQNANPTKEQMEDALNAMLSGKSLQLGLEATNLTFKISGINRIDLQQIVRQRIGVVFSVQCSGDRDLRHSEILVDECIAAQPNLLNEYIQVTLAAKESYARMVDSNISIQAARQILPQNSEMFMLMNTNLSTLLFFHQKRIDDGSQTWSMNIIAQQMADRVCEVYPEMSEVFEKNKTKFKFQESASKDRANTFSTSLYYPKNDTYDYHPRDTLYQKTKEQMHLTETQIDDVYFWGINQITLADYQDIKKAYQRLDEEIATHHYSNLEIYEKASLLNDSLKLHLNEISTRKN